MWPAVPSVSGGAATRTAVIGAPPRAARLLRRSSCVGRAARGRPGCARLPAARPPRGGPRGPPPPPPPPPHPPRLRPAEELVAAEEHERRAGANGAPHGRL